MFCTLQELAAELSALALRLIYSFTFSHPFFTLGWTFSNAFTWEKSSLARTAVSVPTRTIFSQKVSQVSKISFFCCVFLLAWLEPVSSGQCVPLNQLDLLVSLLVQFRSGFFFPVRLVEGLWSIKYDSTHNVFSWRWEEFYVFLRTWRTFGCRGLNPLTGHVLIIPPPVQVLTKAHPRGIDTPRMTDSAKAIPPLPPSPPPCHSSPLWQRCSFQIFPLPPLIRAAAGRNTPVQLMGDNAAASSQRLIFSIKTGAFCLKKPAPLLLC